MAVLCASIRGVLTRLSRTGKKLSALDAATVGYLALNRRQATRFTICALLGVAHSAHALELSAISNADAAKALRAALEKGALAAIGRLGTTNGFLGNEQVRIPLPYALQEAVPLLRTLGQGPKIDELVTAMNRGAEAAVPLARDLLVQAVQTMTVQDAKTILQGGDTAATTFFETKSRSTLAGKFLPIVTQATQRVDLATKYNALAGRGVELGLIKPADARIERHVTDKALDGLYFMIAQEEKQIRQNPVGAGSALLGKVFGALGH